MALSLQQTKRRINNVNSTRKITNAMYLVATAKYKSYKNKMDNTSLYADELLLAMNQVMQSLSVDQVKDALTLSNEPKNRNLFIIVSSSLGLCGGYNNNLFKAVNKHLNKDDELLVIGAKGYSYYSKRGYELDPSYVSLMTNYNINSVRKIKNRIESALKNGEVNKVYVAYTKFVNSITFEPVIEEIYPIDPSSIAKELSVKEKNTLIEPDHKKVLSYLVPLYLESIINARIIESNASEQATRRNAMESATDNADEIIKNLQVEYNKARQSSITQEITEIVAGANAQE